MKEGQATVPKTVEIARSRWQIMATTNHGYMPYKALEMLMESQAVS